MKKKTNTVDTNTHHRRNRKFNVCFMYQNVFMMIVGTDFMLCVI